jgi:hypothetical protein
LTQGRPAPGGREEPLAGNVAAAVVRSGDTVRKPWTAATPAVHAFLRHLRDKRVPGVPEVLGRDERGRQVLGYVPGESRVRQHLR